MTELKKNLKTTSKYIKILEENNIKNIKDFLQYFPRAYEDRSGLKKIREISLDNNITITIKAKVIEKKVLPRWNRKIYEIKVEDNEWMPAFISYFNSYYQFKNLEIDKRYLITSKPKFQYWKWIFSHPEVKRSDLQETFDEDILEVKENYNFNRIYPIYSEIQGIKPNRFAKKMREMLTHIDSQFEEYLPIDFIEEFNLKNIQETIKHMHFPKNQKAQESAIERIFFDRLLKIQLFSQINKQSYQEWKTQTSHQEINREIIKNFLSNLPFELTNAQKKVTKEIIENIHKKEAMMKLLQWDVWSWKTIVATIAAFYTHKVFWWQSVFLAPLEVLANQHHKTLAKLLLPLWIRVELLKWSMTKWQKDKIKQDLEQWKIHVIVGTHALLQNWIKFKNLQFAIVDEQHKFWVKQRSFFKKFGSPHILQMSATPIPRSLALVFFWEFTVSILDEMPAGRKEIYTKIISEKERNKLKPRIMTKIKQNQRIFIITPLIEESEKLENVQSALSEFEKINKMYPELKWRIWLLHWKLKPIEKEKIMNNFKNGKLDILISTTVVEVGVDVPEATIMIIKNAERFWLSQLHQLRWRIWRSDLQSYCFLETKSKSTDSYTRLKAMEDTNDWFKLAEMDLEQRGTWEILWFKQSWESDIPTHILANIKFIEKVQRWANRLLEKYPNLEWIPKLKEHLDQKIWDILA